MYVGGTIVCVWYNCTAQLGKRAARAHSPTMPPRRATEAAPRRLALATMWHFAAPGNFSKGACGLLKWCFSASQLAALPYMRAQHTDVLVVTNERGAYPPSAALASVRFASTSYRT